MKPLSLGSKQMIAAGLTMSTGPVYCPSEPASTTAMASSDLLMYKQKTEQMATLIRHYQTQLESQSTRRDGVETISRLLTESRQENIALKKQHAALQMMVKNLQNRLAQSGIALSMGGDDNEVILPGTSKQTLTNLALENKRLRSLLCQQENGSDGSDSLQKSTEDTQSEKPSQQTTEQQQLQAENQTLKQKLQDLKNLFKSSDDEKDRQLLHYQEEIQRLTEQKGDTTSASVRTVAGVSVLKEQLKALVSQCASFQSHLEEIQEPQAVPERADKQTATTAELASVSKQDSERVDCTDGANVEELLEEKQKLQARVEEVTQMNRRWQEYFNERDRHTKALEQKVQNLDTKLKDATHRGSASEISRQTLDKLQKEADVSNDLRKKAEEEVHRLKQEVAVRDAQLAHLQNQVTLLGQAARQQSPLEAQGVIEHLKAQIQVCTEDFEKERQDRQIALQKVASLQEQNTRLQKLTNHLQTLANQTPKPIVQEQGRCDTASFLNLNRFPYNQSLLAHDSPSSPVHDENSHDFPDFDQGRGRRDLPYQAPGPVSLPTTSVELLSRGSQKPKHSLSDSAISTEASRHDSVLTCPKCSKEFSEEHQDELLTHMDMCWE